MRAARMADHSNIRIELCIGGGYLPEKGAVIAAPGRRSSDAESGRAAAQPREVS